MTDVELVERAKAGELAAFEELVRRHERRVYALCRRMLRNQEDAQDVTQEAFASAIDHLEQFREEASFSTWILRIAAHAALKVIRKRGGLKTVSLADGDDGPISRPEYIADWRESPAALSERRETEKILASALDELPEKYRVVFLLRDVQGLPVSDTAELLGITEANVKVRLLRARLQLRERLTRIFGDERRRVAPHDHEAEPVPA